MVKSGWLAGILLVAAVSIEVSQPQYISDLSAQDAEKGFDPLDELETSDYGLALIDLMGQLRSSPDQFLQTLEKIDAQYPREKSLTEQAFRLTLLKYHAFLQNNNSDQNAYHQQLTMMAKKHNMKWLEMELLVDDAISDVRYGRSHQGLETITKAIELAKGLNATYILPKAYNTAGVLSNANNQLLEAQRYFLLGIEASKHTRKTSFSASIHNNLGLLYLHIENWDKALEYIKQAERLSLESKLNNNRAMHIIYLNQSHIYNKLGEVEKANQAFEKSLPYYEAVNMAPRHNLIHLKSSSDLALLRDDFIAAEKYAMACINYPDSKSLPLEYGQCVLLLSQAQLSLGKPLAALKSVESSIHIFKSAEQSRWLVRAYKHNALVFEKLGESHRALEMYKKYYNQDKQQLLTKVYDLEHSFATQGIQQERDLLDVQNQLARAKLSKEKLRFQMACLWGALAIVVLFTLLKRTNKVHSKNLELETLSNVDQLTGLNNRRYYQQQLKQPTAIDESCEYHLVLFDLDNFKAVNDIYGHDVGDEVLIEAAQRFKQFIADEELLIRWGGEEFLMLLKHQHNIFEHVEAVRRAMSATPIHTQAGELVMTASIGISQSALPKDLASSDDYFRKADQNLYEAKRSGKNQTVMSD